MIKWDVRSISSEIVLWMTDDDAQAGSTSLVGILSSSAFESMLSNYVDRSLSRNLRLLVEPTSFLYSNGSQASYADCDWTSLWSVRSFVGTRVLQELETALGNASLAAASLEKLTALFLVQFATIIAVGYSNSRGSSGDHAASTSVLPACQLTTSSEPCTSVPSAQVFSEAQTQLLRILAHHMVYIAERISLFEPNVSRKRIIQGSVCRWNRRATFQWKKMPAPKDTDALSDLVSSCDGEDNSTRADQSSPTGYPARCYHLSRSHTTTSSCRLAGGFGTCVHERSLNTEPSPMDHILTDSERATSASQDEHPRNERTSASRADLERIRHTPSSTHRYCSDHLLSMSARDGNYAAFESLAETDGMCAPFLCTDSDDDDDATETLSMDGRTPALTYSPSSAPQASEHSFSTVSDSSPSIRSRNSIDTISGDQGSVCRSCKFATLPFDALDQDQLCQFCSALPQHGGDICAHHPPFSNNDLPSDQGVFAQGQPDRLEHEHGSVNLLV